MKLISDSYDQMGKPFHHHFKVTLKYAYKEEALTTDFQPHQKTQEAGSHFFLKFFFNKQLFQKVTSLWSHGSHFGCGPISTGENYHLLLREDVFSSTWPSWVRGTRAVFHRYCCTVFCTTVVHGVLLLRNQMLGKRSSFYFLLCSKTSLVNGP